MKAYAEGVNKLDGNFVVRLSAAEVAKNAVLGHKEMCGECVCTALGVAPPAQALVDYEPIVVPEKEMTELMGDGETLTTKWNRAVDKGDRRFVYARIESSDLLTERLESNRETREILDEAFKVIRHRVVVEIPLRSHVLGKPLPFGYWTLFA